MGLSPVPLPRRAAPRELRFSQDRQSLAARLFWCALGVAACAVIGWSLIEAAAREVSR